MNKDAAKPLDVTSVRVKDLKLVVSDKTYFDEITHIDEYLSDLIYYSDKLTKYEETPEVFDLITDFLTYAKTIGQNVIVQVQ